VKSPRGRAKIRKWFNAKALADTIAEGRAKVEKEVRRNHAAHASLEGLASRLGFAKPDELFAAVARDEINLRQLQTALRGDDALQEKIAVQKAPRVSSPKGKVLIVGMDQLMTQLARCCKPVPPDPIRGFVTRGKGVSVHREDCSSLKRLAERDPERLIETAWGAGEGSYTVDMTVTAADRRGLLRDIGDALAREKINVSAVRTQNRDDLAFMRFTFEIADLPQLKRAFTAVRALKGVIRVARG
jgi:GTP pyrophosphokinase